LDTNPNDLDSLFVVKLTSQEPAAPPVIAAISAGQAVPTGSAVVLTVTVPSGIPLSYQWLFNGTNIDGATNASLSLPNVQSEQAGNYTVLVSNGCGSATSDPIVLSVYPSLAATLTVPELSGDRQMQFSVVGLPGYNYAVQASTNLVDWVPLVTNSSPFGFTDTNTGKFPQRFYRAVSVP